MNKSYYTKKNKDLKYKKKHKIESVSYFIWYKMVKQIGR